MLQLRPNAAKKIKKKKQFSSLKKKTNPKELEKEEQTKGRKEIIQSINKLNGGEQQRESIKSKVGSLKRQQNFSQTD